MKKTIEDYELDGKTVLIRCDFNVPIKDGKITDDTRIVSALKTIKYAVSRNAKVVLFSHLGKVESEEDKKKNSLKLVYMRLKELLGENVYFSDEALGEKLINMVNNLKCKDILLVENTRYMDYPNNLESGNDLELAKNWANLGDIFINDAFGTIHRSHASNNGISKYLPNGIGFLVKDELSNLSVLNDPRRPFMVIMGGSKVSDKLKVIDNLVKKADKLLIGGAMAFTFLKAKGLDVGSSVVEEDMISYCKNLLASNEGKLILPIDVNVSDKLSDDSYNENKSVNLIKDKEMGLDIGTATIKLFKDNLSGAKTVFWNGPLGAYEINKYSVGTREIMNFLSKQKSTVILGGGDIVACASTYDYVDKFTFASTGGGATLKYLEGNDLPGLEYIEAVDKNEKC